MLLYFFCLRAKIFFIYFDFNLFHFTLFHFILVYRLFIFEILLFHLETVIFVFQLLSLKNKSPMPSDLNLKKSWNPQLLKNREKVWKKEQEVLEKYKKEKQVSDKLNEINEKNELLSLAKPNDKSSSAKSSTSWMYQDQTGASGHTSMNEDVLLGKRNLDQAIDSEGQRAPLSRMDKILSTGSKEEQKIDEDGKNPVRDAAATLSKSDPLYAIKLQQLKRKELLEKKQKLEDLKSKDLKSKDQTRFQRENKESFGLLDKNRVGAQQRGGSGEREDSSSYNSNRSRHYACDRYTDRSNYRGNHYNSRAEGNSSDYADKSNYKGRPYNDYKGRPYNDYKGRPYNDYNSGSRSRNFESYRSKNPDQYHERESFPESCEPYQRSHPRYRSSDQVQRDRDPERSQLSNYRERND